MDAIQQWTEPTFAFAAERSGFDPPDDPGVALWRYMDFTKFVSMLERKALFFARADLLGDPFEGSLTRAEAEDRERFEAEMGGPRRLHATTQAKVRAEVQNSIVSCWHLNPYESMGMWRLYLSSSEGVAVQSTFARLTASLPQWDGEHKGRNDDQTERELLIHVGRVHYVDYEKDTPRSVPRILLKRKSFEHEREVRAVATDSSWGNSPRFGEDRQPLTRFGEGGFYVPMDLEQLVSAVYVSPEAQPWFAELARSMVERYGLDVEVRQSDLARDPVF